MNIYKKFSSAFVFSVFIFSVSIVNVSAALTNICPGEPTTLTWSTSNISGTCTGSANHASCSFSPGTNNTSSSVVNPTASCSVTLTCDVIASSDSLTVNPNQSRCCGNWGLAGFPTWNGSSCVVAQPDLTADVATPATAVPGTNNTLSAVIRNVGNAPTPTGFSNFFQVANQAGGAGTVTDLSSVAMGVLTNGNNSAATRTYNFLGGPGTYSIRACADKTSSAGGGVITEQDENNNCGSPWTTVTVACTGTDRWDTLYQNCADPQVDLPIDLVGQYYPPGTLKFSCLNSTHYTILRYVGNPTNDFVVHTATTSYIGEVNETLVSGTNYILRCLSGNVADDLPTTYNATPGPTEIKLDITPRTISPEEKVLVTWDTKFPTNACSLYAKVVCANNACSALQLAASSTLNAILNATTTDPNDPATSRNLQTAIKTVAPGHKDNDVPIINLDWKALGKKTLQIRYTTDLVYDCGASGKETRRIQVTRSEEQ